MKIALTAEQMTKIESPKQSYCLVQQALLQEEPQDRQQEHFWVLGLNRNHTVLFLERLSLGDVRADVQPVNVFRFSIQKNAANIMLMHSLPAFPQQASICDNAVSERLIRAGRILAVEVLDYCMVTTTDYLSFSENNIMTAPGDSTMWIPRMKGEDEKAAISKNIDKLATLSTLSGKRMGKWEGITEVARNLLTQRLDLQEIARATGLSQQDIEALAPG